MKDGTLIKKLISILTFAFCSTELIANNIHAAEPSAPAQNEQDDDYAGAIQVEASHVCMVNDTLMNEPQIPVEIDGKTYYVSSTAYEEKLRNDPATRKAIDPISGNEVDKATAIVGWSLDKKIIYFESLENLISYYPYE